MAILLKRRRWLWLTAVVVLAAVAFVAYLVVPSRLQGKAKQIAPGWTLQQVETLLGEPELVFPDFQRDGTRGPEQWAIFDDGGVTVRLSEDNLVLDVDIVHFSYLERIRKSWHRWFGRPAPD
jgi:hypothetical protein